VFTLSPREKLIWPIVAKSKTTFYPISAEFLVPEYDGLSELVDGHEEVLDDPLLSDVHTAHQAFLQPNSFIKETV